MSLGVVLLLGFVVIGQVRNGLLDAKVKASQSQATGGFAVAKQKADEAGAGTDDAATAADDQSDQFVIEWMSNLVYSLSSGGQGAFDVVTLPVGGDSGSGRGPRASGDVDPTASVPEALRAKVDASTTAAQSYTRITYDTGQESQPALVIGKQVNDPNGDPYQLYYLFPLTQEEKSLSLVKGTLATAGLFVVVLLGAIAWLVVRQVVTPVRMAAGIAERLSAGRLQERMKVTGEDDIARLGEAFNKMAQNLQLKIQQLEDLSRMQRRFVSDVSHELRTPLTTVRMAADVIHDAREDFDPMTARSAELLADQLDRFETLLADLLEISRFDAGAAALEAEPIDLREVVRRVVGGAEPLAERKGTTIRVLGDQQPVVAEADARRVERVLRNLVVNAVEHGDGKSLYVGSLVSGGSLGDPVLVSGGKTADAPLTTPSWDIEGDLWVADRNPADPRLLLFKEGAGKPLTVETPGLDGRIKDVRVAADGVRIALVVEKGGKQSLFVGRIEREGRTGDARSVSVRGLRSTTPELEEVTTMSWAGDSRLVVVGREQGGVQQTRYVQVDGSTPEGPPPAALTGVKEIAASEDDEMPLVAYSEDGIVRLPSGAQWQKVDADGTAPVYPG
ncbi:MtrAB system histidine kinase MtrB [Streptomyces shaanxiensis]